MKVGLYSRVRVDEFVLEIRGRYEGDKIPVMVIVSRYGGEEYIPMMSMEGSKRGIQ